MMPADLPDYPTLDGQAGDGEHLRRAIFGNSLAASLTAYAVLAFGWIVAIAMVAGVIYGLALLIAGAFDVLPWEVL